MKVIIARHAQTHENANSVIQGQGINSLLNEEGIKQAQALADFLKHEKITVAYASPLDRAVHTAQEVLKHHPAVKITTSDHLKERNLGIYEGKGKGEWKKIKKNTKEPFHLFRPEKGESYAELQQRVKSFFDGLIDKHPNDTVFMVSHGGTLGMLYLYLLGKELNEENYKALKSENTAVTVVEIHKDKPVKVHKINSLEHLE